MKYFYVTFYVALFSFGGVLAQDLVVKGRVVDTDSSEPIEGAQVSIAKSTFTTETAADGTFDLSNNKLLQGEQVIKVSKTGYISQQLPILIQTGKAVNIDPILLEQDLTQIEAQIGFISLSDNQLDDENLASFNTSGLLQASNDVFLNAAAFDFSATFFRPRGLDNANGKVLINGVEMNKQFNGRPQWGNWGGLNDVQRNRQFFRGLSPTEYTFGDLAGTTNIVMRASQYRHGGRISYAIANRSYTGRVMASYHSGSNTNGWAYSILASRRFGEQGYVLGTLYDANSFFAAVEKKLNVQHSLNLTAFYTPNRRGRSSPMTQEVKNLKGRKYNPNWGYQNNQIRNARMREVKEPVIILNHYWNFNDKTKLNSNIAYQFGKIANTRIDNGGTRLITLNGQEAFLGGARNPSPDYYQRLPSFFLQDKNPTPYDYEQAYLAEQDLLNDGQLDWDALYNANQIQSSKGANSIYVLQEDRVDDTQLTANTILSSMLNDHITLNAALNFRSLKSENFAAVKDLLGGTGYLDVDFFAQEQENLDGLRIPAGDLAQSDLRNRNRIAVQGDRYKYNYEIYANVISAFVQGQFKYNSLDFYIAANMGKTSYERNGLFENGNFPGPRSFGKSEKLNFTTYGLKAGILYKITGRHLLDLNTAFFTKAPTIRNSFSNARQNNDVIFGLKAAAIKSIDLSYLYRSPIVKARLTGFFTDFSQGSEVSFFFSENQFGQTRSSFVQEILNGIESRHMGAEFGIEAQVTATVKLKAAAAVGQYTFTNNPNIYYTSDDFETSDQTPGITYGDGTAKLKSFHVAGGPERAYQVGFEYSDPAFWWVGITTNYFSNAYVDVSNLRRTDGFNQDLDGLPFNDYNPEVARELLQQEQLDAYFLVNVVGGKSWRIRSYFVGFFASINNVLDQEYTTGGFEQSRLANYRNVLEDTSRDNGPIFGNKYFFGNGTTYYLNFYLRF